MHYKNFEDAKKKWQERLKRIDNENMCVMFTNWQGDLEIAKRFDALPFTNKVIFTPKPIPEISCAFTIKKWDTTIPLHRTYVWWGKRYIDQFDYVEFINGIKTTAINEE